jgi:hypothetical protein
MQSRYDILYYKLLFGVIEPHEEIHTLAIQNTLRDLVSKISTPFKLPNYLLTFHINIDSQPLALP